MLIRKNTKAFKTILEIVMGCRDRPDRGQLVRLYITKAGDTVRERISVEAIPGEAALFYEMNYQAVLGKLQSSNHQLLQSDEFPGIYFFHSSSNKVWDETPFEFDAAVKQEFGSLPELPVVRKKEKPEKFAFPARKSKHASKPVPHEKGSTTKQKDRLEIEAGEKKKSAKVVDMWPKQPDYDLKHDIHFTGLDRIVYRQPRLTKRDVLDYYNRIAEYLLPWLKYRPQVVRLYRDGQQTSSNNNLESLIKSSGEDVPGWIRTAVIKKGKEQEQLLFCNDREHLLFYVQIGCLEFNAWHSRVAGSAKAAIKFPDSPDYLVIAIESPDYELGKAVDVALAAREILTGLQLPCFVKSDGSSGLHLYIPLDSKSVFASSEHVAEYLCKLIRLKVPDLVAIKELEDHAYKKVSLDYRLNEQGRSVVAPYSLVGGQSANVAAPLLWEEVTERLKVEEFNHETIFNRIKESGDPFAALFRKKVNADELLEKLEENYSFLF